MCLVQLVLFFNVKLQSNVFPEDTEQHTLNDDWSITNMFLFLVQTSSQKEI